MTASTYSFADRHIGPEHRRHARHARRLGVPSVETLIAQAVPKSIRLDRPLEAAGAGDRGRGARRTRREDGRQPC